MCQLSKPLIICWTPLWYQLHGDMPLYMPLLVKLGRVGEKTTEYIKKIESVLILVTSNWHSWMSLLPTCIMILPFISSFNLTQCLLLWPQEYTPLWLLMLRFLRIESLITRLVLPAYVSCVNQLLIWHRDGSRTIELCLGLRLLLRRFAPTILASQMHGSCRLTNKRHSLRAVHTG